MAKADKLTELQREIVRAQNDALLRLPKDRDERIRLIHGYRLEKAKENDLIAQAKKDVGSSETLKRLTGTYGLKKQTVTFINVLSEMAAADRSACIRQVINHSADEGWIIPDLFDEGAIGVGSNDEAGDTAGFDATSEGQRRGGTKSEPRTTEQFAASNDTGPAPTPGIPLDVALKAFEEANEKYGGKRGPKPKELKEAIANLEAAKAVAAAEEAPQADAGDDVDDIPELPEAAPGQVSREMSEGVAEAEEHLAEQIEQTQSAPTKPKRAPRKKAAAADATPPAPPVEDEGPGAPPSDDDDDGDLPGAPRVGAMVGDQPATFQAG